jgi:hypothetical protein
VPRRAKVIGDLNPDAWALGSQEELEQWALAAKQKEEDNLVLQKYSRADELRIKELTLHLEKLTQGMVDRKTEVDIEVSGPHDQPSGLST